MRTRRLVALCMALAALTPAAAGELELSYSLRDLKSIARSAHPTLEAADAAIQAATGTLRQTRAILNPEFVFGVSRGRPRDGGKARTETLFEIVQSLELPGIRNRRARVAEIDIRGAEADRLLAELAIDAAVTSLALNLLLEERKVEIAREGVAIAGHLEEFIARRVAVGESAPLELARARTEWFARRRGLLESEGALDTARGALRLLCANRLPRAFSLSEPLQTTRPPDLPDDLTDRLTTGNPLLRRAALSAESARARAAMAQKAESPLIELSAHHETELDRKSTGLAVGLTVPLWNRNRGGIAAATADRLTAEAETRSVALELETSLKRAMTAYRQAAAEVQLHEDGWRAAANRTMRIIAFSFENGETSLLEVLDAQRSHLEVRLAEAASWARLANARAAIERLIAGPLTPEASDDAP